MSRVLLLHLFTITAGPKQKATIEYTKIIAGNGSNTELRARYKLAENHGGNAEQWSKFVGKIESEKYIFDVHWYELKGKQYAAKLKSMTEKKEAKRRDNDET